MSRIPRIQQPALQKERRRRLFLSNIAAGERVLTGDEAHYLRDVLRVRRGEYVAVFDGNGQERLAQVAAVSRRSVVLSIADSEPHPHLSAHDEGGAEVSHLTVGPSRRLTLGVAQPKGSRADWMVEKLTELGVSEIVWLDCERSVSAPRPESNRFERWVRLAQEAARQAGRLTVPSIAGPESLDEFFLRPAAQRFIAHLTGTSLLSELSKTASAGATSSAPLPADVCLAIGPEGGFTESELARAHAAGYISVRLAEHILRVETAALAGAAIALAPVQEAAQCADALGGTEHDAY